MEGLVEDANRAERTALDTLEWFDTSEPKKRQVEALRDIVDQIETYHYARRLILKNLIDNFRFSNGDKEQREEALESVFQQVMEIFHRTPEEDSEVTPKKLDVVEETPPNKRLRMLNTTKQSKKVLFMELKD